jgi:hypothetical protein
MSTTPTDRQGQNDLVRRFREARRANTPLISIATPDQFATVRLLAKNGNGGSAPTPKVTWNLADGFAPVNAADEASIRAIAEATGGKPSNDPATALAMAVKLPQRTILFFHNAQRFIAESVPGSAMIMQRISNLRDVWKEDKRTLVLLGPHVPLPPELANDVVELDEPLPGETELTAICRYQAEAWEDLEWEPTDDLLTRAAAALKGCSAFGAEQLFAMAARKEGIDFSDLNSSVQKMIEQTPGLGYERGKETFDDVGGLTFAKEYGSRMFQGPLRPAVIVRIEEIEKAMSGVSGDTSGVRQDALQVILSAMEDFEWDGMLAFGPPGVAKSLFGKSLANTFGARPLTFDINATQSKWVGESGSQIRRALKVLEAIGGSRVFFIASCNDERALNTALKRRFTAGTWFFDVPSAEDREQIWEINRARYHIPGDDVTPDEEGMTGADIRKICKNAYRLGCGLAEAMRFTVLLKSSDQEIINVCRDQAKGRFIDASSGGTYNGPAARAGRRGARKIQTEE